MVLSPGTYMFSQFCCTSITMFISISQAVKLSLFSYMGAAI